MAEQEPTTAAPDSPPGGGEPAGWPQWVGLAGALLLGGTLVFALYGKALDPVAFAELIEHEGLDFLLPSSWVAAIGLGLEAVLGFALLFNLRHWKVLLPSAGLVAFFVFLTARTYYGHVTGQHEDTGSCGCFGNILDRTPAEAFWMDILLLVPPLFMCFAGMPPDPMPRQRLRWGLTWGLSALVLGFAWMAPGLPIDDLATKLHPDAVAKELCAGRDDTQVCIDDVIPEIVEGEHVVVIADIESDAFAKQVEALNDYALNVFDGPILWVLTGSSDADVDVYKMTNQPAFSIVSCPPGVLRPLHRTLPRTFLAKDGTVTRTITGWPPLADLAAAAGDGEDEGEDEDLDLGIDMGGDAPGDGKSDSDAGDDDPGGGG